jgi:hypothetical protein
LLDRHEEFFAGSNSPLETCNRVIVHCQQLDFASELSFVEFVSVKPLAVRGKSQTDFRSAVLLHERRMEGIRRVEGVLYHALHGIPK